MNKLLRKLGAFLLFSGIGWVIDFGIYTLLTGFLDFPVAGANYLSSVPAITFVFFASTRKTFLCRPDGLKKGHKYLIYVLYQLLLLTTVSFLAQWLEPLLSSIPALGEYSKLLAKICITPVTMLCNFFVLRLIAEKW
ncbi:MAG: GtrA family protein [Oscillospiraceae bacterium]|nr:GtrA family protein [Oscillospiraceae bacterium]